MVSLSCGCYMHGEFEVCMLMHGEFELWVIACMVSLSCGWCMNCEFELWVQHAW